MSKQMITKPFYNADIPGDWEVKKLGDVLTLKRGYDLTGNERQNGTVPVISSSGFNGFHNKSMAKAPGIVMGRYGTIGEIFYIEDDFWPHNTTLYVAEFKLLNPLFAYYLLQTINYGNYSGKSAVPGLNRNDLHIEKVRLPPLTEQKAIAQILSLMDTAINKNNLLIAKKELQKKWLMQKLLTGKKRLKGFENEKWKEISIANIFERVTRKNTEGNTTIVTISAQRGFVRQTDFFNKNIASEITDNYFLVEKGEFCYNKSYSNGYPWGATKRLKDFDKAVVTTLYICFGLNNSQNNSGDFFEQFFEANLLDSGLTKIAHEGGRAHGLLNVTPSDFFSLKITIPSNEEQIAIAQVLQASDKEIQLLKTKTEKLREQKKGVMQVLLTGKKRLKLN